MTSCNSFQFFPLLFILLLEFIQSFSFLDICYFLEETLLCWAVLPNTSWFLFLNLLLTSYIFQHKFKTSLSPLNLYRPPFLNISLKILVTNPHISNLKGVGPAVEISVSNNIGQWSETSRGNPLRFTLPSIKTIGVYEESVNKTACGFSLRVDQVKLAFVKGISINPNQATHCLNLCILAPTLLHPSLSLKKDLTEISTNQPRPIYQAG